MIYLSHIISGSKLPSLSNPGTASDLLSGKQLINENGEIVIGSIPSQSGTTITPGISQKIACSSGRYTTGNIYVAGDANLKTENIKSGVSIFGINGSLESVETVNGVFITKNEYPQIYYASTSNYGTVQSSSYGNVSIPFYPIKNSIIVFLHPSFEGFDDRMFMSGDISKVYESEQGGVWGQVEKTIIYYVDGDFTIEYGSRR